jgi:hypothetical protein
VRTKYDLLLHSAMAVDLNILDWLSLVNLTAICVNSAWLVVFIRSVISGK